MKNKNNFLPYIIIVVLVALVAVTVVILNQRTVDDGNVAGEAIRRVSRAGVGSSIPSIGKQLPAMPSQAIGSCRDVDSSNGLNPAGALQAVGLATGAAVEWRVASQAGLSYTLDSCLDHNTIQEGWCNGNNFAQARVTCSDAYGFGNPEGTRGSYCVQSTISRQGFGFPSDVYGSCLAGCVGSFNDINQDYVINVVIPVLGIDPETISRPLRRSDFESWTCRSRNVFNCEQYRRGGGISYIRNHPNCEYGGQLRDDQGILRDPNYPNRLVN